LESISRFWEEKTKTILKLGKKERDNLYYKIILTKIVRKALKTSKMLKLNRIRGIDMTGLITCPICDSLVLTLRNEYNCNNCGSIISEDWRKELIVKKLGSVPSNELAHVMELRMISEEEMLIRILEYVSEHPGSTIHDIARALGIDA